jgi:hypothetical protein
MVFWGHCRERRFSNMYSLSLFQKRPCTPQRLHQLNPRLPPCPIPASPWGVVLRIPTPWLRRRLLTCWRTRLRVGIHRSFPHHPNLSQWVSCRRPRWTYNLPSQSNQHQYQVFQSTHPSASTKHRTISCEINCTLHLPIGRMARGSHGLPKVPAMPPPCPTLLRSVGGPPLKQPYGRLLPLWTPHAIRLCIGPFLHQSSI